MQTGDEQHRKALRRLFLLSSISTLTSGVELGYEAGSNGPYIIGRAVVFALALVFAILIYREMTNPDPARLFVAWETWWFPGVFVLWLVASNTRAVPMFFHGPQTVGDKIFFWLLAIAVLLIIVSRLHGYFRYRSYRRDCLGGSGSRGFSGQG